MPTPFPKGSSTIASSLPPQGTLADLIPAEDYRFGMRFQRAPVSTFFGPTAENEPLLRERRHWLRSAPDVYAALLPKGEPLLEETLQLARFADPSIGSFEGTFAQRSLQLGAAWEPDFLLLSGRGDGALHLWGGCVCFPSGWSLQEKLGLPIEAIHGVVPGLNEQIGTKIRLFLTHLKPGAVWLRNNWGLSRSPELNQHPHRSLPRLDASVDIEEVWFRVEYQALMPLPRSQGILFGIRVSMHSLLEVKADTTANHRLAHALATMPEEVARYKGLASARTRILQLLEVRS